jgi:TonB family protein
MTVIGRVVLSVFVVAAMSGAWAQGDAGGLSDAERAKRDAQKVFSFIKFSTVKTVRDKDAKPVAPKPASAPARPLDRPTAVAPAPVAAPARPLDRPTAVVAAPAAASAAIPVQASTPASAPEPTMPQEGTHTAALPAQAVTLPPVSESSPQSAAPVAVTEPEPEPEPEEVELKLVHYVAPEMNRQVIEAIGERSQVVPVRFVVDTTGRVIRAEPKAGVNRRLGQVAAKAVSQWRFEPLPAERTVDVELAFKLD